MNTCNDARCADGTIIYHKSCACDPGPCRHTRSTPPGFSAMIGACQSCVDERTRALLATGESDREIADAEALPPDVALSDCEPTEDRARAAWVAFRDAFDREPTNPAAWNGLAFTVASRFGMALAEIDKLRAELAAEVKRAEAAEREVATLRKFQSRADAAEAAVRSEAAEEVRARRRGMTTDDGKLLVETARMLESVIYNNGVDRIPSPHAVAQVGAIMRAANALTDLAEMRARAENVSRELAAAHALVADLVVSLPGCDECGAPATRAWGRGGGRWCDGCAHRGALLPAQSVLVPPHHGTVPALPPEYPRAAPLRALVASLPAGALDAARERGPMTYRADDERPCTIETGDVEPHGRKETR